MHTHFVGEDDAYIHHGERVAGGRVGSSAIRDVDTTVVAVVHIGWVPSQCCVDDLAAIHQPFLSLIQDPVGKI